MYKKINVNNHKNLELLRYYISNDLKTISDRIGRQNDIFFNSFVSSTITIILTIIINEQYKCLTVEWRICLSILVLAISITSILLLRFIYKKYWEWRNEIDIDENLPQNIQKVIDSFDNIACDGLLTCEFYMQRYDMTDNEHLKKFYYYEIIHYAKKILKHYRKINANFTQYVGNDSYQKLDIYRVKNFIDFVGYIDDFLQKKVNEFADEEIRREIFNIHSEIVGWNEIK